MMWSIRVSTIDSPRHITIARRPAGEARRDALRALARRCPGFSQAEYERAFAQGMFERR
jgi:hypothetical protein